VTLGATASTTNIDVNNTEALINKLNDINNSANNGVSAADNAFNDVYGYATGAGATPGIRDSGRQTQPCGWHQSRGRWGVIMESSIQSVDKLYVERTRMDTRRSAFLAVRSE